MLRAHYHPSRAHNTQPAAHSRQRRLLTQGPPLAISGAGNGTADTPPAESGGTARHRLDTVDRELRRDGMTRPEAARHRRPTEAKQNSTFTYKADKIYTMLVCCLPPPFYWP